MASSIKYNLILRLFEKSDDDVKLADKRALALQIDGDKTIRELSAAIINKYKSLTGVLLEVQELRDGDDATLTDDDLVEDCFTLRKEAAGNSNLYTVRVVRGTPDPEELARRERQGSLTIGGSGDFRRIGEREAAAYQAEQENARRQNLKRRRGDSGSPPGPNTSIERNSAEPEAFHEAVEASQKRQRVGGYRAGSLLDPRQQSVQFTHSQARPDPEPLVIKSESPEPRHEENGAVEPHTPYESPPSYLREGFHARKAPGLAPNDPDEVSPAKSNKKRNLRQDDFPAMVSNPIAFMGTSKSLQTEIFSPGSQEPLRGSATTKRQVKPLGNPSRLTRRSAAQAQANSQPVPPTETTSKSATTASSDSGSEHRSVATSPSGHKRRHDPSDQLTPLKFRVLDKGREIATQALSQPVGNEDGLDFDIFQNSQPMEVRAANADKSKTGPSHHDSTSIHSHPARTDRCSPKRSILKPSSSLGAANGDSANAANGETGSQQAFRRSVSFANEDQSSVDNQERRVSGIATSYAKKRGRGPPPASFIDMEARGTGSTGSESDDLENDTDQVDDFSEDSELVKKTDRRISRGNIDLTEGSSTESESDEESNESITNNTKGSGAGAGDSAKTKRGPSKDPPSKAQPDPSPPNKPKGRKTRNTKQYRPSKVDGARASFLAGISKIAQVRPQPVQSQIQNHPAPVPSKETASKETKKPGGKRAALNKKAASSDTSSAPTKRSNGAKAPSSGAAKLSSPGKRSPSARVRSAKVTSRKPGTKPGTSPSKLSTTEGIEDNAVGSATKSVSPAVKVNSGNTGDQPKKPKEPESKVPELLESSSDGLDGGSGSDDGSEIPPRPLSRSQSNEPARHVTDEESKPENSTVSESSSESTEADQAQDGTTQAHSVKHSGPIENRGQSSGTNRNPDTEARHEGKDASDAQKAGASKLKSTNMDIELSVLMNPKSAKEPISMLSGESSSDGDEPRLPELPKPDQGKARMELTLGSDGDSSDDFDEPPPKLSQTKANAKTSSQATTVLVPSTQEQASAKQNAVDLHAKSRGSHGASTQSSQFKPASTPTPAGRGRGKNAVSGQGSKGQSTGSSAAAAGRGSGRGAASPNGTVRSRKPEGLQAMMDARNKKGTSADKSPINSAKVTARAVKKPNFESEDDDDTAESDNEDDSDTDSDKEKSSKKMAQKKARNQKGFASIFGGKQKESGGNWF